MNAEKLCRFYNRDSRPHVMEFESFHRPTCESAVVVFFFLTLLLFYNLTLLRCFAPRLLGKGRNRFKMAENRPCGVSVIASDSQAHDLEKSYCACQRPRRCPCIVPCSFIDRQRSCRCAVQSNSCPARKRHVPNAEPHPYSSSRSRPCGGGIDLMFYRFDETTAIWCFGKRSARSHGQ